MSATPVTRLTPEEYLELERAAKFKSEYYDGRMYAMSGTSLPHWMIKNNIAQVLAAKLKGRCRVGASDLRIRVSPRGLYTYPDVIVICGEPQLADDKFDILLNPTILFEVLSPSTERYDRVFKAHQYKKIESLREYVLVSQSEPRIEILRRQEDREWEIEEAAGMDATCRLASVDCEVEFTEIFEGVTFEQPR